MDWEEGVRVAEWEEVAIVSSELLGRFHLGACFQQTMDCSRVGSALLLVVTLAKVLMRGEVITTHRELKSVVIHKMLGSKATPGLLIRKSFFWLLSGLLSGSYTSSLCVCNWIVDLSLRCRSRLPSRSSSSFLPSFLDVWIAPSLNSESPLPSTSGTL